VKSQATYEEAHLVVAAVRVLEHREHHPPTVEDVASLLGIAREWAGVLVAAMEKAGIVAVVESAFTARVEVRDHLALEQLPRAGEAPSLRDEMAEFAEKQRTEQEKLGKLFQGKASGKPADRPGDLAEELKRFRAKRPRAADFFEDPEGENESS